MRNSKKRKQEDKIQNVIPLFHNWRMDADGELLTMEIDSCKLVSFNTHRPDALKVMKFIIDNIKSGGKEIVASEIADQLFPLDMYPATRLENACRAFNDSYFLNTEGEVMPTYATILDDNFANWITTPHA